MEQVKFGLFDWIDRGKAPLQKLYEERLRLLEVADSAGFLGYHLAEHHFTPLGMAPSPHCSCRRQPNGLKAYAWDHWVTCCPCTILCG